MGRKAVPGVAMDLEELRIALAMTGGVSLAVWMGGVAMEVSRLVQQDPFRPRDPNRSEGPPPGGVYGELLRLTSTRPKVDIIAGASAGGLNGAILAMAMVHGMDLLPLRSLWLTRGGLGTLFRSPFQPDPPSLLRGDEYFLPAVREALGALRQGQPIRADLMPLQLLLTTTILSGEPRTFVDDFGSILPDVVHRGQFVFGRGTDAGEDDFLRDDLVDRLALAGRSTASFPGAFEASFIPVNPERPVRGRPDMAGTVSFRKSRFVVDGGVLVNKPVRPVLRAIFAQPAGEEPVRRVLAYVVPDPGPIPEDVEDDPAAVPSLAGVVKASLVTLPRAESVASEIDDIAEHNRRAEGQRLLREQLLTAIGVAADLDGLAADLFELYRRLRVQEVLRTILANVDPDQALAAGLGDETWRALQELLVSMEGVPWIPQGPPAVPVGAGDWPWGVGAVEYAAIVALDLFRRAMEFLRGGPEEVGRSAIERRERLAAHRRATHDRLRRVRELRDDERRYWREQTRSLVEDLKGRATGSVEGRPPLRDALEMWLRARPTLEASLPGWGAEQPGERGPVGRLAAEIAAVLAAARADIEEAGAFGAERPGVRGTQRRDAAVVRAMVSRLVPGEDVASPVEECLRLLIDLAVIQYAAASGMPVLEQTVQMVQVSANAPNGLDARDRVDQKVAGIQLGHFGTFYKRSWRANDWIWGRLDGAQRLVQILLDPARLRDRGLATNLDPALQVQDTLDAIARVALPDDDPRALAVLEPLWRAELSGLREELAFLADPNATPPKSLPRCATAVARRIQLDLLREELLVVAQAVEDSRQEGGALSPEARDFLNAVDRAPKDGAPGGARPVAALAARLAGERRLDLGGPGVRLVPEAVVEVLQACRVGQERIGGEAGTDLFTTTAATAAAVGVSAASGKRSGLGLLRPLVASLRGFVLVLFVLARSAVSKSRTGFAVMAALLASGGAILALAITSGRTPADGLMQVGMILVGAGIVLATYRAGPWITAVYIAATLAVAIGPYTWVRYHLLPAQEKPLHGAWEWLDSVAPALPVASVVIAAILLGLLQKTTLTRLAATALAASAAAGVVVLAVLGYRDPSLGLALASPAAALVLGFVAARVIGR